MGKLSKAFPCIKFPQSRMGILSTYNRRGTTKVNGVPPYEYQVWRCNLRIGNLHSYVRELVLIRHVVREDRRGERYIGKFLTWPMRYPTRD